MTPRYLDVAATAAEAAHVPVDLPGLDVGDSDIVLATGDVFQHVSDGADEGATDWPTLVEVSAVELGRWLRENVL